MRQQRGATVELGGFVYDVAADEPLDRRGARVRLRPQCQAVLRCLAMSPGRLVSKDALMRAVWPDVVVTDDSLVQCVKELRRALDDGRRRLLQTEPRRGYRLMTDDAGARSAPPAGPLTDDLRDVRFATADDGVRLAFAVAGRGTPLVRAAPFASHLQFELECLVSGPLLREFARRFRFARYDPRGQGLSDRDVDPGDLDRRVRDLESVVDAAGVERFVLFAIGIGSPIAIRLAVLHPERVDRMVLLSASARGVAARGERSQPEPNREAWLTLIRDHWESDDPIVRQMATTRHFPRATREQCDTYNELMRRSLSTQAALAVVRADALLNVDDELSRVACPTLVIHNPEDTLTPFFEGRRLASGIPGARLALLEADNRIPLENDPAFEHLLDLISDFVAESQHASGPAARRAFSADPRDTDGARDGLGAAQVVSLSTRRRA